MNSNLQYDFLVHKDRNTIEVKREFDAQLPIVWNAFTRSDILDKWWAPRPWKAQTKNMDFQPGGSWFYAMVSPQGEQHWSIVNYETIEPFKGYTAMDGFTDADGNLMDNMPRSKWHVHFVENGDKTIVEFSMVFTKFEDLEAIIKMGFKEGLSMAMENLDEMLPAMKQQAQQA